MKTFRLLLTLTALLLLGACTHKNENLPADAIVLLSPDARLELKFALVDGVPEYSLSRHSDAVILPSRLGFALLERESLDRGFTLCGTSFDSFDETWEPV